MMDVRMIRTMIGVVLLLVGVSAVVYFDFWPRLLLELTAEVEPAVHSWLTVRIILISLLMPGILLIGWQYIQRPLLSAQRVIAKASNRTFLFYVLSVATVMRILAIIVLPLRLWADWDAYHRLALLWASSGQYTMGDHPTAFFPPGWPFFLSRLYLVFGGNPHVGLVANVVLGVGICYFVFRIVGKIWGNVPARWATLLLAVFPSQIIFVNILCSEILFTFLFLLALDVILHSSPFSSRAYARYFAAGLILGAATLTRSVTLLYPLALVPFFLGHHVRKPAACLRWLAVVAGLAIVTVPWIIRNYYQVGRATISTNGGVDFYAGNHPPSGDGYPLLSPYGMPWDTSRDEAHLDSVGYRLGFEYIRQAPLAFVRRGIQKVLFMLISDTGPFTYELYMAASAGEATPYFRYAVIAQSYYLTFLVFAGLGIIVFAFRGSQQNPGDRLLWATVVYWLGIHFVFFGIGRFHFPIIPLLAGFAGLALAELTRRAPNRQSANAV